MHRKRLITRTAAVVALGCLSLAEFASGQDHCKQAKGNSYSVAVGSGPASGTITNAGDLTGTFLDVFNSGAFPTPDPMIVSFGGEVTITTHHGVLRASAVHFFDFTSGVCPGANCAVASVQLRINPATSTGRFAGATGFLFLTGTSTLISPFINLLEVSGQICYARN